MTARPPWAANRIADVTLEANRDRATVQRVQHLLADACGRRAPIWPHELAAALHPPTRDRREGD